MTNQFAVLTAVMSLMSIALIGMPAQAQEGSKTRGSETRGSATRGSTTKGAATEFDRHETPPAGLEDVYGFYAETFGMVPNMAKVMANSPALTKSYVDLQKNLKEHATLSEAEVNIVQMAIAVENKCTYCTAGHTMAGAMFFKTPQEQMNAIRGRKSMADPKLQALRNFAIAVYQGHGHPPQKYADAFYEAGYTPAQALDVVACIAAKVMTNYTNALGGTELDDMLKPLAMGLDY